MNTTKTKLAKVANMSIQRRSALERTFIDRHSEATAASNRLRINRVYAGQTLLELKEGFGHGEWLPYLLKLCARADVAERTARQYIKDAQDAAKIPHALLVEAERQGFNPKTRCVRENLIAWLLQHPDSSQTPKDIVADALDELKEPPSLTAEEEAARDARQRKFLHSILNGEAWREAARGARAVANAASNACAATRRQQQETFAEEVIDAGYKTLAKKYHPDAGGKSEQFQLLKESTELLRRMLKQRTPDFGLRIG